jgi:hypothetical protein
LIVRIKSNSDLVKDLEFEVFDRFIQVTKKNLNTKERATFFDQIIIQNKYDVIYDQNEIKIKLEKVAKNQW